MSTFIHKIREMFKAIQLSPETAKDYEVLNGQEAKDLLDNLSRINIFIGSNNSGKSRLLRELFARKDYQVFPSKWDVSTLIEAFKTVKEKIEEKCLNEPLPVHKDYLGKLNKIKSEFGFIVNEKLFNPAFHALESAHNNYVQNVRSTFANSGRKLELTVNEANELRNLHFEKLKPNIKSLESSKFLRYYIPTLRSLKDLLPSNNTYRDIYNEKTTDHYFYIDGDTSPYFDNIRDNIFTGLGFYDKIKYESHHDYHNRQRLKSFEQFISESFFNNAIVEITPHNDKITRVTIDGEERKIEHLGDGIQSIIILTYQLFMNQGEKAAFFFEEPETHLHPGFQRLFIETLRRPEFHTFQYYISTHSNHFLDITLEHDDMSVYTFKKEKRDDTIKFIVENVAHQDDNILQLIGANKSSVFLSNCTIWVEGITDRIYLRKYLDLYQDSIKDTKDAKVFKEDYHYSFVEYGGGNITHWSFLDSDDDVHKNINVERLCAKAFVVTDSDNAKTGTKKKQRQELLKEKLGDNGYYCLEAKEIENLLTKEIIEKVVLSYEKENTVVDFAKLEAKDIPTKGLGKLIDSTIKGTINKKKYKHKSSDTLNDKVGFAKRAVEYMDDFNELSGEAKKLTKKLNDFINANNK